MNTRSPPLPQLSACIARSVQPFIAHASGSLMLGCALHTLYSALVDAQATPSSQLEVAAHIAAFCTKMWLVQLVVDSAQLQSHSQINWAAVIWSSRMHMLMITDAALAACSHIVAMRLAAHNEFCDSGCVATDLRYLLCAFALYLAIGACILFGRSRCMTGTSAAAA